MSDDEPPLSLEELGRLLDEDAIEALNAAAERAKTDPLRRRLRQLRAEIDDDESQSPKQ